MRRSSLVFGFALVAPLGAATSQSTTAPADLVVINARIYTVDDGRPIAEALAIRGGRLQFVGSERGALTFRGPQTRTYDARGATVIPGIADAHVHLLGLGMALRTVGFVSSTLKCFTMRTSRALRIWT